MSVINTGAGTIANAQTGRVSPMLHGHIVGVFRLPTDPLFTTTLTLQNIIGGSRYRVTRTDTGAELATGLVAGSTPTDQVISGVNAYANPQQVSITVRHASGSPVYKVFNTSAFLVKEGVSAYILQQLD